MAGPLPVRPATDSNRVGRQRTSVLSWVIGRVRKDHRRNCRHFQPAACMGNRGCRIADMTEYDLALDGNYEGGEVMRCPPVSCASPRLGGSPAATLSICANPRPQHVDRGRGLADRHKAHTRAGAGFSPRDVIDQFQPIGRSHATRFQHAIITSVRPVCCTRRTCPARGSGGSYQQGCRL